MKLPELTQFAIEQTTWVRAEALRIAVQRWAPHMPNTVSIDMIIDSASKFAKFIESGMSDNSAQGRESE